MRCLCYLRGVVLTFDQSAFVICFSPPAACEQELCKHVLPPQEANGSLLITGKAGRQEARSPLLPFDHIEGTEARRRQTRTMSECVCSIHMNWQMVLYLKRECCQPNSSHTSPAHLSLIKFPDSQTPFPPPPQFGDRLPVPPQRAPEHGDRSVPGLAPLALTPQWLMRHHSDPPDPSQWGLRCCSFTRPAGRLTGQLLQRGRLGSDSVLGSSP